MSNVADRSAELMAHRLLSLFRLLRIATLNALRSRGFYVTNFVGSFDSRFAKFCFSIIGSCLAAFGNGLDCSGVFCERVGSFTNSLLCFGSVLVFGQIHILLRLFVGCFLFKCIPYYVYPWSDFGLDSLPTNRQNGVIGCEFIHSVTWFSSTSTSNHVYLWGGFGAKKNTNRRNQW